MRKRMETFPPIPGLLVHHESDCDALDAMGKFDKQPTIYCVIHRPSPHHMAEWPLNWRADRGLMERICPHGVGHPDPDDIAYKRRTRGPAVAAAEADHGCDGCCVETRTGYSHG